MLVSVEIGPDDIVEAIEALSDAQLDILALMLPDRLMDRVGPLMETLDAIADLYPPDEPYPNPPLGLSDEELRGWQEMYQ